MEIVVSETDGVVTLVIEGEVDVATRDQLRTAIEAFHGDVRLDMSGVTFLDSSGIGALMLQRTRLDATRHTLSITNPSRPVRDVLALVGLDEWLEP